MDTAKTNVSLDDEIDRVIKQLNDTEIGSDEYKRAAENLNQLCTARGIKPQNSVSKETMVAVAANLIGLILVLSFEHTGVITSKAIGLLFKGRN